VNPETYSYLRPLIAAEGENEPFLRQVFGLARSGIDEHVATITSICGRRAGRSVPDTADEMETLAVAVHRLTNVITALRLEELARRLNVVEGAARRNDPGTACHEFGVIAPMVQHVAEEVDRGLGALTEP